MALIYKPISKENVDRNWKTTLTMEIISDFLQRIFPNFEEYMTKEYEIRKSKILLEDSKIRLTYFNEGKERIIDEVESNIQPASTNKKL
ncbi:MAG: hypothetical protein ACFFKA_18745 [Candidatus Thorarchaeota archaeon]